MLLAAEGPTAQHCIPSTEEDVQTFLALQEVVNYNFGGGMSDVVPL